MLLYITVMLSDMKVICVALLNFRVVTVSYRYFSQLVKNETDLVLLPFKTHGGKLMEALLECLEKVCSNVFFLLLNPCFSSCV
jgi:hypothetical protein